MQKLDQQSRLAFIDFILYWEAELQNKTLTEQFGISRQQARQDYLAYCELYPLNASVSSDNKIYSALPSFTPQLFIPDIDLYLNWVENPALFSYVVGDKILHTPRLQLPPRQVNPAIIRVLVKAMRTHQRVEVDYVSLQNPSHEGRIISPHSFFNTGLRWHLRAWCEKHQQYRDFVLSRFRGEAELIGISEKIGSDDESWQQTIELIFAPDKRLHPEQQAVIAHDYQMQNGQLRVTTKKALVHYLLQEMQVNTKVLHGTPEAQQLELVNLNDIKPWLFS